MIERFADDLSNIQVPLSINIWRVPGCHELLSSLGFDLMGVGRDEVVLRSGRANLRRPLQCALQAIIDLFGELKLSTFISFYTRYQSLEILKLATMWPTHAMLGVCKL